MDRDEVEVHKNAKRELGQYPAILTLRLVNNIYMLFSLSALLDIVGKMQKYMDEQLFSCGIFINLRKAFDAADHDILPYKLHRYEMRGVINKWFCPYLIGRFQTTQIEPKISKKELKQ